MCKRYARCFGRLRVAYIRLPETRRPRNNPHDIEGGDNIEALVPLAVAVP